MLFFSCIQPAKNESVVVATNSWTAAFAKCAGADSVLILAPMEMEHPSEYELRATDIPKLIHARIIIYAGYETMVKHLQSGMDLKKEALLKIDTDYSMATIEKSVMAIAQRVGTEKVALQNIDSIRHLLANGKIRLSNTYINSTPVVVNFFQLSIVKELGFKVAGVFGPGPMEANDIDRMAKLQFNAIVDNVHNPVGKPLSKVNTTASYKALLNFPGLFHTTTIQDVIKYNLQQLESVSANIRQ